MPKKFLLLLFLSLGLINLNAQELLKIHPETTEEALFMRRVIEFWKDGDFKLAKAQIEQFLNECPGTSLNDQLYALLGELCLRENNTKEAILAFSAIESEIYKTKILLPYLQCLFEIQDYALILKAASYYFETGGKKETEEERELTFLYSEALFRSGLNADEERKKELFSTAKDLMKVLEGSSFELSVLPSLAFIYKTLNQTEEATAAYKKLSQFYPDHREEYLFQAALLEAQKSKEKAIETFKLIMEMKGKLAKEAAFNRFILLYELERYQEVVDAQKTLTSLEREKKAQLDFAIGSSYFALQDYEKAIPFLNNYCNEQPLSSEKFLTAINYLATCAYHMEDLSLFQNTLVHYKHFFPQDHHYAKALFLRGMIAKKKGNLTLAEEDFGTIIKRFPHFDENEKLYLEYALIACEKKEWEKAYDRLTFFQREFPKNTHRTALFRHLLNTSLHLIQITPSKDYSKADFEKDLKIILNEQGVLTEVEQKEYRFLLAKTSFELQKFEETIPLLNKVIEEQTSSSHIAEAELLLAYSHKNCSDLHLFCTHLEKSLELNETYKKDPQFHLELFNAYLKIPTHPDHLQKGSEHLYLALEDNPDHVKLENRLWLANFFYEEAKKGYHASTSPFLEENPSLKKAKKLYMVLFNINDQNPKLSIPDGALYLENEVFKFASLLQMEKEGSATLLFEDLISIYQKSPDLSWQNQKEAYLELGKCYFRQKRYEEAISTFNILLSKTTIPPSKVAEAALLERCRAEFALFQSSQKEPGEKIEGILSHLKQLQIRKQPSFEPIHLEAALEYARIRSLLADENKKDETYLFFLKRFQEDFSETAEDVLSRNYFFMLNRYPEQKKIVDVYLKFVSAEIAHMNAKLNKEPREQGIKGYQLLLEEKEKLTPFLKEEIAKILKLL